MKWHDGQPVTVEDVIFSFQAPAGDKAPMYKPFVTDIAAMEKTGDADLRFKLKQPNATFLTASLAKINLIPKHIWEPVLKDLAGKPENAEQLKEPSARSARARSSWCAGSPTRRSCSSAFARSFQGAQGRALDHAHRAQRRGDARHAEARRDQLPRHLRRRRRGAGEVRQGEPRHRRSAARSTSASSTSPSTTAARRSTTWPSAARCRSPSTAG